MTRMSKRKKYAVFATAHEEFCDNKFSYLHVGLDLDRDGTLDIWVKGCHAKLKDSLIIVRRIQPVSPFKTMWEVVDE